MRPARVLTWTSGILLGIITLLVLLIGFAVGTTMGTRFLFLQVENQLGHQLVIGEVHGTIAGPLGIRGLQYNAAGMKLRIERVELAWLPGALFSRSLFDIEDLKIQGLQVILADSGSSTDENSPPGLPEDLRLPLAVHIKNFTLNEAAVTRGKGKSDELISLRSVHATDLSWRTGGIEVPYVRIKSPQIDVTASALIKPEGDWPLGADASYSLNLQAQQLPTASGTIALSGSLAQLEIMQTVDSPYSLRIDVSVSDALLAPSWQASVRAEKTRLAELYKDLPAVDLIAQLSAEGDTTQASLNADLQVEQSAVQISGKILFSGPSIDSPEVDLKFTWQKLIWPLDSRDNYLVASDRGKAHVSGVLDAYRATVNAQVAVPAYPTGTIDTTGAGTPNGFAIEQLALSVLGGNIQGHANIDWHTGIKATFNLAGNNIDPAGLYTNWPGVLSFTSRADAAMNEDGTLTSLQGDLTMKGELRGKPISATMTGHLDESGLTVPSLVVNVLGTTLNAEGNISTKASQPMDFQWRFAMNDLGFWTPGMTGNVQAQGRLTGTVKDPRIKASLTAANVSVAQLQIDHAVVTTDLGLGTSPVMFNADLEGLQLGETQVGKVELDVSGTLARHVLGLRSVSDSGANQLALSGSLSDLPVEGAAAPIEEWSSATWQFSFDALDINEGEVAIDLIREGKSGYMGKIDGESLAIDDTCFTVSGTGGRSGIPVDAQRVCAQVAGNYADEFSGNITFNNIPLMVINPLLPATTGLTGSLGGSISLGWNVATSTPRATILLDTSAADLQSTNSQGEIKTLLHFEPGQLNANWTNDALSAVIELPLTDSAGLKATASVAPGQGGEFSSRAIEANVIASFDDLDWMADFLQGVTQLSGKLESNLKIDGTLSTPNLLGTLSLKNGKAVLPGPGLTLRELDVAIIGAGNEGLTLTGSVKSGGGLLSLEGHVRDIGSAMTGKMSFTGKRVLILNTPEAEIYASPTINADLQQRHLNLAGEVSIDEATIQLASLPQTAAAVSSDQIIVVAEDAGQDTGGRFDVTTRLRLLLNDAVSFSGFGLDATFGGDISLVDLPGKPTTANGDINVQEGSYRAYGQNLTIETGKLLFVGGPIDQPGINVRAVRQVTPDIKVGALARGNLRAPEFSIFSEPTMNQSDQLAYLVLGRPLSTSSSGESSVLSRAALAMGIKGGNYLTEQFGSKLRVDKIGIETAGNNEEAALVVGKYLSPKLFVSYGIGVLDAVSTLKIEYLLSSRWRVSSESSVEGGGLDLNYVLER